jgi:hypothetical protein
MKHVTNGDKYLLNKLRHAVTDTQIFDWIYMFPPTVVASVKGLYLRCAGQLLCLE